MSYHSHVTVRHTLIAGVLTMSLGGLAARGQALSAESSPPPNRPSPRATENSASSRPACTLINVDRSRLGTLVEAKLLEDTRRAWLEREEVDKVLAQQQLQAVFGAQAGPGRIALGKLIKADVLVLLRTETKDNRRHAELVVAETAAGLRLLVRNVLLSDNAESDATTLVGLVEQALQKHGQTIRAVYAVSPLVSQDLTYEHDHLKTAYAKLIEESLLSQPGVLVVELAEAEALAREYDLAAPADRPSRRSPTYVLGEYRHEGRGQQLQVTITLRVKHGDEQFSETRQTLASADAPGFLQQAAARLAQTAGSAPTTADPVAEAAVLARRADEFVKLGNWAEALSLLEASLLLQPEQIEARCEILRVLTTLHRYDPTTLVEPRLVLARRARGLQHLEALLRQDDSLVKFAEVVQEYAIRPMARLPNEDLERQGRLLRRAENDFMLRAARRLAEAGRWMLSSFLLEKSLQSLEPKNRYATRAQFILAYQDRPDAAVLVKMYALHNSTIGAIDSIEGRAFLNELQSSPRANDVVRGAAGELLVEVAAESRKKAEAAAEAMKSELSEATTPQTVPAATSGLTFRPLQIAGPPQSGGTVTGTDWLALDNGIDIVWGGDVLKLAEKGRAEQLWNSGLRNTWLTSVAYDGRYLWVTADVHQNVPQVLVIEPVSAKVWKITADDGLPLRDSVMATPVAQGRAIVAGSSGGTWLASVDFDPAGKHRVKIFHEARETADEGDRQAWKSKVAKFSPAYMVTLTIAPNADSPGKQRVLVGRTENSVLHANPLVVDPETLAVEVLHESFYKPDDGCLHEGAVYYTWPVRSSPQKWALYRMGLPELKPSVVINDVERGQVLFQGNKVHIVGKRWWWGKLTDERLTCAGELPWRGLAYDRGEPLRMGEAQWHTVAASNQYGLLVTHSVQGERGGSISQVMLGGDEGAPTESAARPVTVPTDGGHAESAVTDLRRGPEPRGDERLWHEAADYSQFVYSPDGKLILTVRRHRLGLQVWNAADGRLLANPLDRPDGVDVAAFSPDGRLFATGSRRGLLVLWSAESLQPLRMLPCHNRLIATIEFAPDGQSLASSMEDALRIWNVSTGQETFRCANDMGILFLEDSKRFLTGNLYGGYVKLWNLRDSSTPLHAETLRGLGRLMADGSVIGLRTGDPIALIAWNPNTYDYRTIWEDVPESVMISPGGRYLFIYGDRDPENQADEFRRCTVYQLETHREVAQLKGRRFLAWLPGSDDSILTLSRPGLLEKQYLARPGAPLEPLFPQGQRVASGAAGPAAAVASSLPRSEPSRTWRDGSGKFSTEATLLELLDEEVRLQKVDGKTIEVPLARLCAADQQFVRRQTSVVYADRSGDWQVSAEKPLHGLLVRELSRQALLLAAREQLGLTTRDACLGDPMPGNGPNAPFDVASEIDDGGNPIALFRRGFSPARRTVLELPLDAAPEQDPGDGYLGWLEKMEQQSRTTLPTVLQQAGFRAAADRPRSNAVVDPRIEGLLGEMTCFAQFQAIRQLHRAIQEKGESPALLGAMVRGYSNLGQMCGYLWSPAHKVYRARALLYAQRMIATDPQHPAWGRWHRGYALAMAGLHVPAMRDLQTPSTQADPPRPDWVTSMDAYCRYDYYALQPRAGGDDPQLNRLLSYLIMEAPGFFYLSRGGAEQICARLPECYRVRQGLWQSAQRQVGSIALEDAMTMLRENLYKRLAVMPDLPAKAREIAAARQVDSGVDEQKELQTRGQVIASLGAEADADDRGELSWPALGDLIREITFVQTFYTTQLAATYWRTPVDDRLEPLMPVVAGHRYAPLLKCYFDDPAVKQEGMSVVAAMPADDFQVNSSPIYDYLRAKFLNRSEVFRIALCRNADAVAEDLTGQYAQWSDDGVYVAQLERISPHSPPPKLHRVGLHLNEVQDRLETWEQEMRYSKSALVFMALTCFNHRRYDDAERCLRLTIQTEPDSYGYHLLMRCYVRQNKKELWQSTLQEFLRVIPDENLAHAMVQHDLGMDLMVEGRFDEAQPLLLASAETGMFQGILLAAQCCEAQQDWQQAERLWRRVGEVTGLPSIHYSYCRRTGHGDLEAAKRASAERLAQISEADRNNSALVAHYYEMEGEPEKALEIHQQLYAHTGDPLNGIWLAVLADQLGKTEIRDETLRRVTSSSFDATEAKGEPRKPLIGLAGLLVDDLASGGNGSLDAAVVESLGAQPGRRTDFDYCLGKYFSLHGNSDRAVEHWKQCMADSDVAKVDRTRAGYELLKLGIKPEQYKLKMLPFLEN